MLCVSKFRNVDFFKLKNLPKLTLSLKVVLGSIKLLHVEQLAQPSALHPARVGGGGLCPPLSKGWGRFWADQSNTV